MILVLIFCAGLSAVGFSALAIPRYLTLIVGLLLAVFAFSIRSSPIEAALISAAFLLVLVMQLIVPLVIDFGSTLFQIPFGKLIRILGATLVKGSPFWLVGGLLIWGSIQLQNVVINKVFYEREAAQSWGCGEEEKKYMLCKESPKGLEGDIEDAFQRAFDYLEATLVTRVELAVKQGNASGQSSVEFLHNTLFETSGDAYIEKSLPKWSDAFRYRSSCGLWAWVSDTTKCIKRMALRPTDDAYRNMRAEFEQAFDRNMNAGLEAGDRSGAYAVAATKVFLRNRIAQLEAESIRTNKRVFLVINIYSTLSLMLSVLMILKGVLIIYARYAYDPKHGNLTLKYLSDEGAAPQDILVENISKKRDDVTNSQVFFEQSLSDNGWYAHFDQGVTPHLRGHRQIWPRPFALLWPRLKSGRLLLTNYNKANSEDVFGGAGGVTHSFVRLTLPEGSRVVVRMPYLLAFTKGAKLRSVLDVRLSTLLQQSFYLRVIEGPAQIIFSSETGGLDWDKKPAEPIGIVAFDLAGAFTLDVKQNVGSIYGGGYSLLPSKETTVIRTAVGGKTRNLLSVVFSMLFFLLPI